MRASPVCVMAPAGQASMQAAQKMQRPRSSATGRAAGRVMATVGHTGTQALQPGTQRLASTRSAPP